MSELSDQCFQKNRMLSGLSILAHRAFILSRTCWDLDKDYKGKKEQLFESHLQREEQHLLEKRH